MISLSVILKPVGGPTIGCTRLGCATPSRSFVQFQRAFPTKESLVYRRAGEAIRYPLFQSVSAPRSCTRDEGRPLGAGLQGQAPNRLKLLWSNARVVSVKEKAL